MSSELTKADYAGSPSTLCLGCGHNTIANHLVTAAFDLGIQPGQIAKLSGIGCSSKSLAYFLGRSHGFNTVHGRAPSVATGAKLANANLHVLCVSGDGDTANIGIGQFAHMIRRNVNLVYIIENNGVFGLTKGQFSATSTSGAPSKRGSINPFPDMDTASLAIELGCGYVARTFSGDQKQILPILKGALAHRGTAIIDVISPCVAFNNHEGSTRSFNYVREHNQKVGELDFIEVGKEDHDQAEGKRIRLSDGSHIVLKNVDDSFDPTNANGALSSIREARDKGKILTGLLYQQGQARPALEEIEGIQDRGSLSTLAAHDARPSEADFQKSLKSFR